MPINNAKAIVVTTINPPSDACRKYARLQDWRLIVVGDAKTPDDWALPGAEFLALSAQTDGLSKALPRNSYSRKMLGYLAAIEHGAEWILDSDDDTAPLRMPDEYLTVKRTDRVASAPPGFVNSYKLYGEGIIWPRGFPLEHIHDAPRVTEAEPARCPVRQFMIEGDTDVDAIYRLTHEALDFKWPVGKSYAVDAACYCPFNSQATLWHRSAFPLLYLPSTCTMRACDIIRGYVAQRCLRAQGWQLGLGPARFTQQRNPHDYLRDFQDEIPIYLYIKELAEQLDELPLEGDLLENLRRCYATVIEHFADGKLLQASEADILEVWIQHARESEHRDG